MRTHVVQVLFCFLLVGCVKQARIDHYSTFTFDQLPDAVQDGYRNYSQFAQHEIANGVLGLDKIRQYEFEAVTTGPWTDYYCLRDKSHDKEYKIPYGEAFPFVIYEGSLYIPTSYNLADSEDAGAGSYKRFVLE